MGRGEGLLAAAAFPDLVIALRGDKPFIPKGVHRFSAFEESREWSIRMMGRRRNPDRPARATWTCGAVSIFTVESNLQKGVS